MKNKNAATHHAMDWILQYGLSTKNNSLLSSIAADTSCIKNMHSFSPKTKSLFDINQLKAAISITPYDDLMVKLIKERNILTFYHSLYHLYGDVLRNKNTLKSLNKNQKSALDQWIQDLFVLETEFKVQVLLSVGFWRENYIQHKKWNDLLLHPNKYNFDGLHNHNNDNSPYIQDQHIIKYIKKNTNGDKFIHRIHQQLDYLGQQFMRNTINLNNKNDETVQRINEFLDKHKFDTFKHSFLSLMNSAQNKICGEGKDFLSRLAAVDISKLLQSNKPNKESVSKTSKFALRSVVDVKIGGDWCSGTVIQKLDNGSLKIAMHSDDIDD